jgi:ELWxxDGT repeat protein
MQNKLRSRKPLIESLNARIAMAADMMFVKDINTIAETVGGTPTAFVQVGTTMFFTASGSTTGQELWKTDGTPSGTMLVKDIRSGGTGSGLNQLTNVNGTLFFSANNGTNGSELWKTDGTTQGTVLVRDIRPGTQSSNPSSLVNVGGTLFFSANDGNNGTELWKSDGTTAGTVLVRNIRAGTASSTPANLTEVAGAVYFTANDGTNGVELWRSDGTNAGTTMVRNIRTGLASATPSSLVNVNGTLFFSANDGTNGVELWSSNGTSASTVMVSNIFAGATSSNPTQLTNVGGTLYFSANEGTGGIELWKSNGTSAGTQRVADIFPGTTASNPTQLTAVGTSVYFAAQNASGIELWKSDGTAAGTQLVRDIQVGAGSSNPSSLKDINGTLYFAANNGVLGTELWKSDGTLGGTSLVRDIRDSSNLGSNPSSIVAFNGQAIFQADDGLTGAELWISNGTSEGTSLLKEIRPGSLGSQIGPEIVSVGANYFFTATDGVSGVELWMSNGTAEGTVMVKDINPGMLSSAPTYLTNVGGILYFVADDGTNGAELWMSDGTQAGTVLVKDIAAGIATSEPTFFANVNGTLYFAADNVTNGMELWKSDGTEAGTVMVKDIYAGTLSSLPNYLTNVNGTLFFVATDLIGGTELWKSDGTNAGTIRVKDIRAGLAPGLNGESGLTNVNGIAYFTATTIANGNELWKSDGTDAGTVMVKDIFPGPGHSYAEGLTEAGGFLYFTATDGVNGYELWKSDGSFEGTVLVRDINPGALDGEPEYITAVGGNVFFFADDGVNGTELWRSDGTAEGTLMMRDIAPGAAATLPTPIVDAQGIAYFVANDGVNGPELWQSDGTEAGTIRTTSITSAPIGSNPTTLGSFNGRLVFAAEDELHGNELWAQIPNVAPTDILLSGNSIPENSLAPTQIGTLSSLDADADDTFTYTLVPGTGDADNTTFEIIETSLRAKSSFDFETKPNYSVRVRSTDQSGLFTEKIFTITVTDVAEAPSEILLSSSTIAENLGANATVGTLSTIDSDLGDTHSYSLATGAGDTDNAAFVLAGNELYAVNNLNFETKSSYLLRIRSTDSAGMFVEKAFTINVVNANENPSDITISSTVLPENAGPNATVGTLNTLDVDASDTFTYQLIAGVGDSDNAAFNISGNQLRATNSFDYETQSSYSVRLRSTDQGGLFTEKVFVISVTNVNEAPTELTISSTSILEDSGINAIVGTFTTTDADAANTFSYSLVAGTGDTDNAAFNISANTLRATNNLSFITQSSYTVRVRSTDQGGLSVERSFTIQVLQQNVAPTNLELTPSFIFENSGVNALVGSLNTTDANAGDTFTYSFAAGLGDADNSSFNIDAGSLRASNNLDYESRSSYSVRLRTTDQGGLSFEKVFIVHVLNQNEAPTDVTLSTSSVAEGLAINSIVGLLTTVDADAANSFTYSLVNGTGDTDNAAFNISENALRTSESFDFETKSSYTIRIRSTDQGGLFTENIFVIGVTDANETPIDIDLSNASIAENSGPNATVGTLSTIDADAANRFDYSLVDGTGDADNTSFNIFGDLLRATNNLVFATKSSYSVRIRSTDQGGLFTEKTFVITVTDVNRAPTDISLSSSTTPENAGTNAAIGEFSATDPDIGDTFTFALVAGTGDTDNAAFTIDGSTLRASNSFDFETKSSYSIRIRSTDQDGLFTEKVFIISVNDVNEAPTDIALSNNTIDENAGANASIGNLTTSDEDAGNTFTYSLVAGTGDTDNAAFNINGATLRATTGLNFESKSSYSVRLRSTDQNGLFVDKVFLISVNDVNEAPTDVILSNNSIPENSGDNALVGTLSSIDADAANTFTYSLATGTGDADNASFNIVGSNLRASNNLSFATKSSYSVRIRTTDQDGLFVEKSFVINVLQVNNAPTDISISSTTIAENLGANATVGILSTTDSNASDTFTYTLVAGTGDLDNSAFNISGNVLRATNNLDFETKANYTVRIRSTDQGGLFTEESFSISVTDAAEEILIPGTNGNDTFVANYTGDGVQAQWLVTRNGTIVFNGVVPTGQNLWFDGLLGTDSLQIVGRTVDDSLTLDANRIAANGAWTRSTNMESFRITGGNGNDTLKVISGTALFDGGAGTDRLEAITGSNTFSITGAGAGNLNNTVTFTTVESLLGGADADRFVFGSAGTLTGQVLGGAGSDTIDLSAKTNKLTLNLTTNMLTSTGGIFDVESFISGTNTTDTVVAPNTTNNWNVSGVNQMTLNTITSLAGFENVTGGTAADRFDFGPAGRITGTLTAGTGTDVASFAAVTTPILVQLGTAPLITGLVGRYVGLEIIEGNSVAGSRVAGANTTTAWTVNASGGIVVSGVTFNSIPTIAAGTALDTLTGPAVSTRWNLNAANGGSVSVGTVAVAFSGIENLTGSTASDEFIIAPTGTLSGNLNGGTGTGINSVDYSDWTTGVTVNLSTTNTGNATAINGAMTSIQMVTGGSGNDSLTGRATLTTILIGLAGNDVLIGGSQRDILIGGSGADILQGAAGDDLLISGTTSYDRDRAALLAIHAEWISARTFAQRTSNLFGTGSGARANGNNFLNNAADSITDTVFADTDTDILTGGTNQDWFFAELAEITDPTFAGTTPDRRD